MSLLSKWAKSVKKRLPGIVGGFLTGGVGGAILGGVSSPKTPPWPSTDDPRGPIQLPSSIGGGQVMQASMLGALPAIAGGAGRALVRVLPGAGAAAGQLVRRARNVLGGKWSKRAIAAAGYFQIGQLVYDAAGNIVGSVGRRRINPLNHRALSRAITRVCAARRICARVDQIAGGAPRRRRKAPCPPGRSRK